MSLRLKGICECRFLFCFVGVTRLELAAHRNSNIAKYVGKSNRLKSENSHRNSNISKFVGKSNRLKLKTTHKNSNLPKSVGKSIGLMLPAVAVQLIFSFVASWNNFFIPGMLLDKAELKTVPIMVATLRSADYSKLDMGKVYMFILLAILPVVVVYVFLSKFIIRGVSEGSVKG